MGSGLEGEDSFALKAVKTKQTIGDLIQAVTLSRQTFLHVSEWPQPFKTADLPTHLHQTQGSQPAWLVSPQNEARRIKIHILRTMTITPLKQGNYIYKCL